MREGVVTPVIRQGTFRGRVRRAEWLGQEPADGRGERLDVHQEGIMAFQ
jgi:hypothetical protein